MSDPIEILERRLNAVLDQEATTTGLHFFCQIGGYDDPLGIITFQVSGSGKALLSWRHQDDEVDLWTLQFSEEDYYQFIRLLMTYRFWTASPPRRGREEDDEINIHLRLSAQDVGTYKGVQFWNSEIDDYEVLRRMMEPLCKLMQSISYDEISDDVLDEVLPPS